MLVALLLQPQPSGAASKDTELILAQLRQLQTQLNQLQQEQANLQATLDELRTSVREEQSAMRRLLVDSQLSMDTLRENLSIVAAKMDESNARLGNVALEVASMKQAQPILIPPAPEGEVTRPADPGSPTNPPAAVATPAAATPPPSVAAVPGPVELYNQAYTDYTQARYPLAISGFRDVIARFPESDLADNAQYWIGECLLAQRKYKEALEAFDGVLSLYANSNKLDSAAYKKAIAYEGMGSRADAVRQLEEVIERFPRSDVARAAREKLRSLR
jgi:tol-pal system protein YbgF